MKGSIGRFDGVALVRLTELSETAVDEWVRR